MHASLCLSICAKVQDCGTDAACAWQVLLATCYEDWQLEALKGRQGSQIALTVDATGAVAASTADLGPPGQPTQML